jgi:Ala-tRNA(Pro) deacylase
VTACEKLWLDELSSQLEVSRLLWLGGKLMFGRDTRSVTMMGLANDIEHKVELWIDEHIWQSEYFQSHPLVNTATLIISKWNWNVFLS